MRKSEFQYQYKNHIKFCPNCGANLLPNHMDCPACGINLVGRNESINKKINETIIENYQNHLKTHQDRLTAQKMAEKYKIEKDKRDRGDNLLTPNEKSKLGFIVGLLYFVGIPLFLLLIKLLESFK